MRNSLKREDVEAFVKENYWSIILVVLTLVACGQGLTLYLDLQSWDRLDSNVKSLHSEFDPDVRKGLADGEVGEGSREVEVTFFYHPKPEYTLTAILEDRAVISAKFHGREVKNQEVRVGDRIENATVTNIAPNVVTLQEEGAETPKEIQLHPGS